MSGTPSERGEHQGRARRAGVSVGTTSNVLNRPELVWPETRAKVLAAIDELGFVRNESARQLRSGGSRMLAYVVLDAGNPFFTDVARGIDEVARDADFTLFLCNSGGIRQVGAATGVRDAMAWPVWPHGVARCTRRLVIAGSTSANRRGPGP